MSVTISDETVVDNRIVASLRQKLSAITYTSIGLVEAIVVTPRHDEHILMTEVRVMPTLGVIGDGPYKKFWKGEQMRGRQISASNAEVLDALDVGYTVSGDNLIIRGIDLSTFESGDGLRIGDAVLVATGVPHRPCSLFAGRTSQEQRIAIGDGRLRGAFFDALDAATIRVGDPVERIILDPAD
jgi:hypothetical protein